MLIYFEEITQNLENGINTENIFLDMEKAFDQVDQDLLAHRIKEKHIIGKIGIWLNTFISNRNQRVLANGSLSLNSKIISGVLQGTVIGPILFLLIIESLRHLDLDCDMMSFVDNIKIKLILKI